MRVPADHGPEEGKIKGLWERFASPGKHGGVIDLRVDLQPPRRRADGRGEDAHYGSARWANLAVQFGANAKCARSSRAIRRRPARGDGEGDARRDSGAFAGVLMRTDTMFTVADVREAMARSFAARRVVRLGNAAEGFDDDDDILDNMLDDIA